MENCIKLRTATISQRYIIYSIIVLYILCLTILLLVSSSYLITRQTLVTPPLASLQADDLAEENGLHLEAHMNGVREEKPIQGLIEAKVGRKIARAVAAKSIFANSNELAQTIIKPVKPCAFLKDQEMQELKTWCVHALKIISKCESKTICLQVLDEDWGSFRKSLQNTMQFTKVRTREYDAINFCKSFLVKLLFATAPGN